jgi:hypothetical protein
MSYRLYISYRDIIHGKETFRFESPDPIYLFTELNHTDYLDSRLADSLLFPTLEAFTAIMNSLTVGQMKNVIRLIRNEYSYICSVKRLA